MTEFGPRGGPSGASYGFGGEPIVDWIFLSRQTFGDLGLENELLALFLREAETFGAALAALRADDAAGRRRELAHTIKGAASAIGARALAVAAECYESALDLGDGLASETRLRDLEDRLRETREAIASRLAS